VKLVSGEELAGYIKERQAREVRALRQAWQVQPKLAIVSLADTQDDLSAKVQAYGADILIDVDMFKVGQNAMLAKVQELDGDANVHGIVQVGSGVPGDSISPAKDVAGQGQSASFDPTILTVVSWVLAGYNIDPQIKKVVLLDRSSPADQSLSQILQGTGVELVRAAPDTDPATITPEANVVIDDIGPLAVCALFENVIRSARRIAQGEIGQNA
jgi:methylenetetrahydrofolate dehydrogenase (NADP+) / methenyltetrahydrofolate cyclohydrolase